MMSAKPPAFFDGFNFARFPIGATALFLAILAAGNEVADWSALVSDWRDTIKVQRGAIFRIYVVWMAGWFAIELLRLKLRHDLATLKYEKRKRGKGRR